MHLYLVVRHPQNPEQTWANSWLDNERLESITTPTRIGHLCLDALEQSQRVFIHRCGWGDAHPVICCSAVVVQSVELDPHTFFVTFGKQQVLNGVPPVIPHSGQSYYQV
jgi:hypothetical protein